MFMPSWPPYYPVSGKIMEMLELLGNPHLNLPPVIHVTGTNGKGSTVAFMKQILKEHEIRYCSFTSPHLLNVNENFTVESEVLTDDEINRLTEEIRLKLGGKIQPSFFEFQTTLAFLAFSRSNSDICLVECGMGAKNDPTNIIPSPLLSVITPISYDHQKFLGNSIEEITLDKCHVIKNAPVISAPQNQLSEAIINKFCELQKVDLHSYQQSYDFQIEDNNLVYADLEREELIYYQLPELHGDHQIINLVTAITVMKKQNIFEVNDDKINQAITKAKWPGRLENIKSEYKNLDIWFDGAHNAAGAESLKNWLSNHSNDNITMIYGRTANTDHENFLKHFLDKNLNINFVTVKNEPNSETSYSFKKFQNTNNKYQNINISDSLEDVFIKNILPKPNPQKIIICGSLYLYRDLHEFLNIGA